ncbi:2-oxoglutarate synthase [Methanomicrobiaceae archaeon CYW5]|uniref:thiamine pyrophosphate-dependent enzyme n=1 Tax=Methanovulcanius yangii TaxID=1789227 RepID=UPI0029C9BE9F|nr:thiamine pyrophosphate-dependent enzyme [Methanovulcanius yangii]MBT8507177.1 2-oxoglutarate synthase [Methanovulcanius yangii]
MNPSFITDAQNTWCLGCGNFALQHAIKDVIFGLIKDGTPRESIVLVAGIGCHGKIADYLNISTFYSLHGRAIAVATGIKLANPDLTVICSVGDGDTYAEGLAHLIFAAKRNIDITVIVHNNRVYGLTKGQYTPTSPGKYHGKSTPRGISDDPPFNPVEILLCSGCGFIARGYTRRQEELTGLIHDAIVHRGFSVVDTLQICASFLDMTDMYNERVYVPDGHNPEDFAAACMIAREWDYDSDGPIALGTIYRKNIPTYESRFRVPQKSDVEKARSVDKIMRERS